jgi:hypothetical protein
MSTLTRWLAPVRQLAAAFFQHELTLKREQGQVHVVLAGRRPAEKANKPPREDGERRRRRQHHEELMLVRTELAALLNELPETRSTMRHLVFVEQALEKKGFKVLNKVPLDVMHRAHEQLENLVTNWSPAGLANLRSRMAVAIIDREHMDPEAEADAYRTAAVLDAGERDELEQLERPAPALAVRSDEEALAEAYAALDTSFAPPPVEMQGELGSASARELLRPQRRTLVDEQPAEITIRVLQP